MKRALRSAAIILLVLLAAWPWFPVIVALAQSRSAIAPALFFGRSGHLDDATSGGRYTALTRHRYVVQITSTGTPNQFKWTKDGDSPSSAVNITGSAQTLADGVAITFAATTGHSLADVWVIYATPVLSLSTQTFVSLFGSGGLLRPADQKAGDWVSLKDFCVADGVTDCAPGAANWIQAAKDRTLSPIANGISYGAKLTCPAGKYAFKSTVVVEGFIGLTMDCDGAGTQFIWQGNTTGPVINLYGVQASVFENFSVIISPAYPLNANGPYGAIQLEDGAPGDATSTSDTLKNIVIRGNGYLSNGIVINNDASYGGTDANNDFHHFDHVRVDTFLNAAALLLGSQDFSEEFDNCAFNSRSASTGLYGVEILYHWGGTANQRGNIIWQGGGIASVSWDFYMDGYSSFPDEIEGPNDETYGGFLYAVNDGTGQIYVNGVRWYRENGSTDASTDIIHVTGPSIEIANSLMSNLRSGNNAYNVATIFYQAGPAVGALMTMRNFNLADEGFTTTQIFTGDAFTPTNGSYRLENVSWVGNVENEHGPFESQNYSTGTITATARMTSITGSGTAWTGAMNNGFIQIREGSTVRIYRFTRLSTTTSTLDVPYAGTGGSGLTYVIGYAPVPFYMPSLTVGILSVPGAQAPPVYSTSPNLPVCNLNSNEGQQVQFSNSNVPNVPGNVITGTGSFYIPLAICDANDWVVH